MMKVGSTRVKVEGECTSGWAKVNNLGTNFSVLRHLWIPICLIIGTCQTHLHTHTKKTPEAPWEHTGSPQSLGWVGKDWGGQGSRPRVWGSKSSSFWRWWITCIFLCVSPCPGGPWQGRGCPSSPSEESPCRAWRPAAEWWHRPASDGYTPSAPSQHGQTWREERISVKLKMFDRPDTKHLPEGFPLAGIWGWQEPGTGAPDWQMSKLGPETSRNAALASLQSVLYLCSHWKK
jgi:hypothetical protein